VQPRVVEARRNEWVYLALHCSYGCRLTVLSKRHVEVVAATERGDVA